MIAKTDFCQEGNIMRRNVRTDLISVMFVLIALSVQHVYAFLDDFERKKLGDDWKKSPTGQEASWSIEKGEVFFNGVGGDSQMMTGEEKWHDYTVECDIKFGSLANYPGGIRTYVDVGTGGHYAVWFYPPDKVIRLYSGTAWNINTGLVKLGENNSFDPKLDTFYHLKVVHKGKQIQVWFGKNKDRMEKIIEAEDDQFKSGLFAFDGYNQPIHFDHIQITGLGIPVSPGEAVESQDKLATVWGKLKVQ